MPDDPRRNVPRTDTVLADPRLVELTERLGRARVKEAVGAALAAVRAGAVEPAAAADTAARALARDPGALRPVLNATGVVLHTNLGRAPLSAPARAAALAAAGYVDVEFDRAQGRRAKRARGLVAALLRAVPAAEDALVVNNGAAALVLATTLLTAGREVIVSRGEMVEIGDGFRLPDLIESTGTRIREVGTTNRVHLTDYVAALGPDTGAILKVHPSNFRVEGFTSAVPVGELAGLGVPLVVDLGSGLLAPHPLLPDEPDAASTLAAGADLVTCSGDKLLGGPQAGLLLGRAALIERLRRHPLARAVRVDKITIAALAATLDHPPTPTWVALTADPDELARRARRVADAVGAEVVACAGAVGGGSAPGQELAGWAVALDPGLAEALRLGEPAVVGRIEADRLLLDLRCVPAEDDDEVIAAIGRARR